MTCPRRYNLESEQVPACASHCPIRRGANIPERWHSVNTAIQEDAPGHARIKLMTLSNAVWQKQVARRVGIKKRGKRNIPECGLIAFFLLQDHKRNRAQANKQDRQRKGQGKALDARNDAAWGDIRKVNAVRKLALFAKGARRPVVVSELIRRERARAAGHVSGALNDAQIAALAGVTRQCVGYHKRKLGI
jgi:hypothetical protein